MIRLRDIMTHHVLTVNPETTIREAMELLFTNHLSGAPVMAGGAVVGVVSANDLLGFASAEPGRPGGGESDEDDALRPWDGENDADGAYFAEPWGADGGEAAGDRDVLDEHTVAEVMTRSVCQLPGSVAVPEAAEYMRLAGIHRVLVIDDGTLVGIVTTTDITRAVAEHRLTARTYVFGHARHYDARRL